MKRWVCKCGETQVTQQKHEAHITGRGWVKNYYTVICYECRDKKRIGLEPVNHSPTRPFNYDPEIFGRLSKEQKKEVLSREEVMNKEELREHSTTRKRSSKPNQKRAGKEVWVFVD